jgi:hypothetical protein
VNREWKFLNQHQPQTLVIGTMFCYIDAVFGFLFGVVATSLLLALITILGLAAGGFGIANEKKWGYAVGVVAASLQFVMLIAVAGSDVLGFPLLLNLVFDGALVALLLHPESREYQRIWFK